MNKQMILLALAAGSITAVAQHGVSQVLLAHHQGQHETPYDLMANQPQPDPIQLLEQLPPGEASATGSHPVDVPPSILPADAEVGPGTIAEPGSARPQIRTKQGWSWKNLLPQPAARPSASLVLTRTKEQLKVTKDPIWQLQLVDSKGTVLETLPAVTGRSYRQTLDRHVAGNKSPLPRGVYSIDRYGIDRGPFSDPELGQGYWIPVTPLFSTGRSALGFHQDPSWGKLNGESGTSGCIGLENKEATIKLVDWIRNFNVTKLTVNS